MIDSVKSAVALVVGMSLLGAMAAFTIQALLHDEEREVVRAAKASARPRDQRVVRFAQPCAHLV